MNCEHEIKIALRGFRCGKCGRYFDSLIAYAYLELNYGPGWEKEWERIVKEKKEQLEKRKGTI